VKEWTETTARRLCLAAGGMLVLCAAYIAGRVAAYRGLWKPPELGAWATIALWAAIAAGLLFSMDRGIPREGTWSSRLYWMRRILVIAIFITIGVMVYLK
jgi:hypothetical protein